jgi:hypothetical protein
LLAADRLGIAARNALVPDILPADPVIGLAAGVQPLFYGSRINAFALVRKPVVGYIAALRIGNIDI